MKVATVIGARPQFIKAAPVSQELHNSNIQEILIHTGQHYDLNMSEIFFVELNLAPPDYYLGVGSGPHGWQTGRMLEAVEGILIKEKPDWVLVYGDTNSTLAGALAAVKLRIPVVHVEAGLRSYNLSMPEEINRRLTDQIADLLLCPTREAVNNLIREGFSHVLNEGLLLDLEIGRDLINPSKQAAVINVGDVMYDILLKNARMLELRTPLPLQEYGITKDGYVLATIHRAENTDHKENLENIVLELVKLRAKVVWPIHPRTGKYLVEFGLMNKICEAENIVVLEPVGYTEMILLLQSAQLVITDSGGLQKEACMLGVPCLTCRDETEWTETVKTGWNKIIGLGAFQLQADCPLVVPQDKSIGLYGDGMAAQRIVRILANTGFQK